MMGENTPDRKVAIGAAMGGVIAFIAWVIETFGNGIKISADAALGLQTAMVFIVQYLVPNRERPPGSPPAAASPFLVGLFVLVALIMVFSMAGCTVSPTKPVQTACAQGPTFEPKRCVKTIGETYEIYQKQALAAVQDPGVPEEAKERIRKVDAEMTPALVEMLRAARVYDQVKLELAAGGTEQEKLDIANRELLNWINIAEPILLRFIEAIGG